MTSQHDPGIPFVRMLINCAPFFPLLADFRGHPTPTTEHAQRAHDRRVMASFGRWLSLVQTVGILVFIAFGSRGLLAAPALILAWLFIVNRFVWANGGTPSPRAALAQSHLVWWTLSLALAATWAALAALIFPAPFWGAVSGTATALATVLALGGAYPTARAVLRAQEPAPFDDTLYRLVAGVMRMTPTAMERGLADGSFTVERDALGQIVARIPPGSDALLEDIAALSERIRVKAPAWMLAHANPVDDVLVLEPVDDETSAQRDAVARSGGLFAEHPDTGLVDADVIDLSHDTSLPRL